MYILHSGKSMHVQYNNTVVKHVKVVDGGGWESMET